MREIKFRAWIYDLGKMMPVKEIDFDDFMPSVMVEINSERHEQMFFENTDYPDCELMQYTGLKDKNGKEIYEYNELDGAYEVIFKDLKYSLRHISNNDIIGLQDYWRDKNGEIEVTREYTKV